MKGLLYSLSVDFGLDTPNSNKIYITYIECCKLYLLNRSNP